MGGQLINRIDLYTGKYSSMRHFDILLCNKQDLIKSEHRVQMCKLGVQTSDWIR